MNQMQDRMVHNQKENCHSVDHIPLNLKGIRIYFFLSAGSKNILRARFGSAGIVYDLASQYSSLIYTYHKTLQTLLNNRTRVGACFSRVISLCFYVSHLYMATDV